MRLDGKVSIMTGAGSGIGRATALRFASEGARVVVADIDPDGGNETVRMIKAAGGDAAFVRVDVTRAADLEGMARFAREQYGRVDVLFNNAGISSRDDIFITELTEETWSRVLATNLTSMVLACKYVVPDLIAAGGGSIVNTASIGGLIAVEILSYSAAKAGVMALTRGLAAQLAYANIRVNAVAPGVVNTPMLTKGKAAPGPKRITRAPMPESLLGRLATPEEIANVVLFLASDEASYITGAVYPVDGGITAR